MVFQHLESKFSWVGVWKKEFSLSNDFSNIKKENGGGKLNQRKQRYTWESDMWLPLPLSWLSSFLCETVYSFAWRGGGSWWRGLKLSKIYLYCIAVILFYRVPTDMDNLEILDNLKHLTNIKILTCHETNGNLYSVYTQNVYKYIGQTLWEEPWIHFFACVLWTLPKNMITR